jgi:hypothetical protein
LKQTSVLPLPTERQADDEDARNDEYNCTDRYPDAEHNHSALSGSMWGFF